MNAIFSFLGKLVWPALILVLIVFTREELMRVLRAIRSRIEKGDEFSAGPSGVKLGQTSPHHAHEEREEGEEETNPGFFVVHKARRDKSRDRDGYEVYRLRIFLENDLQTDLGNVEKVVYHLHPTFPDPDRTIDNPDMQFELRTYAWGQFNLTADVYIKGRDEPLRLERYLNF